MVSTADSVVAPVDRGIGFWICTALVMGNVIGMGIFLLPASLAPFGFNALIGWAVTLVGCLALARVFASLARAMPGADGPYTYIGCTLGRLPAFVALWAYWVSIWPTDATLATGVVGYLRALWPAAAAVPPAVLALALVWIIIAVNLFGVRTGGVLQVVTTVLKLAPMAAIAVLGAWVLVHAPADYTAHLPTTPVSVGAIMSASTLALFAMIGIESAAVPAARVIDPGRTIPRATMTGTIATTLVYIVVSIVPLLLIAQGVLGRSSAPLALVVDHYAGGDTGRWIALFVVVSGVGALNGWTLMVGELTRTLADNHAMPGILGRGNRFGAPAIALTVIGVGSSIMIAMSYSASLVDTFTFLMRVVTASNLPLYLGCVLALAVAWRRGLAAGRARRIVPVVAIGLAFVVFAFIGAGAQATLLVLALCAAGLPLYALMRHRHRAVERARPAMED